MLLDFMDALRRFRVPVGPHEWLALMQALSLGLHGSRLDGFYHLARSLLVHSEAHFDAFDQAFATCFQGIEGDALALSDDLREWLSNPALLQFLDEQQKKLLQSLDLDELRRLFEERLREQRERHQGGSRFIGTGGTSPFGQGGYHPTGIRVGDQGGGRSAAQVAALRRFRAYRQDLVLDVRQIELALRRLRELRRDGQDSELDLPATVDRTCREAGELELVFRPPRRNRVKVLLLMDVGGSMDPHARVVSLLFSAANRSRHFRSFAAYYFHNCIYGKVYKDAWFQDEVSLDDLFRRHDPLHKLIVVGDALMHPLELFSPGGMIDYWSRNRTPGIDWLGQLARRFERRVWLNPEPPPYWRHQTVQAVRGLFPMFPLTLRGLEDAVHSLVKARCRPRAAPVLADGEASPLDT